MNTETGQSEELEATVDMENGAIRFENLTFDSEGTYEYTISEANDKQTGVIHDENVYKITVSVTDDGSGVLAEMSGALVLRRKNK